MLAIRGSLVSVLPYCAAVMFSSIGIAVSVVKLMLFGGFVVLACLVASGAWLGQAWSATLRCALGGEGATIREGVFADGAGGVGKCAALMWAWRSQNADFGCNAPRANGIFPLVAVRNLCSVSLAGLWGALHGTQVADVLTSCAPPPLLRGLGSSTPPVRVLRAGAINVVGCLMQQMGLTYDVGGSGGVVWALGLFGGSECGGVWEGGAFLCGRMSLWASRAGLLRVRMHCF